jgi:hypothetical protein
MSFLNRGKKSSKFRQVIVNYGRFVGFKEQLGFFEASTGQSHTIINEIYF